MEEAGGEEGLVVDEAGMSSGAAEHAALRALAQERLGGPGGALDVVRPREGEPRARERSDHQTIPGSEDLGVGERRRPRLARLVQLGADAQQEGKLVRVGHALEREHVLALAISLLGDAEELRG